LFILKAENITNITNFIVLIVIIKERLSELMNNQWLIAYAATKLRWIGGTMPARVNVMPGNVSQEGVRAGTQNM
jgi:hypothetical protein